MTQFYDPAANGPEAPTQPNRPERSEGETLPYLPPTQPHGPGAYPPDISSEPLSHYQPIAVRRRDIRSQPQPRPRRPRPAGGRNYSCLGCGCGLPLLLILATLGLYFLAPLRTNLLVLGVDRAPEGTALGRTDTIILVSVEPLSAQTKMLSIPRDLWITLPGGGENRINTVHFFAEAEQAGSGPETTLRAVRETFGVRVPYYARLRFDGVVQIVDAMGGVDVELAEAMSGYGAGMHHLNGDQALAFARDRAGSDDFFRMARGQMLIGAVVKRMLSPAGMARIPQVSVAMLEMVDTNIPVWQWPRLGLALVRAVVFDAIDSRTFDREMTTPWITNEGASVLLPNWDLIRPVVREMFGP